MNLEEKKLSEELMNKILNDLFALQIFYFNNDTKFTFLTDIISRFSFFVKQEVSVNEISKVD